MKPYSKEFRGQVRQGARLIYLPPYSSDSSPIELVFSKFKWLLKNASVKTVDSLWSVCGDLLDRFTETQCRKLLQALRLSLQLHVSRMRSRGDERSIR